MTRFRSKSVGFVSAPHVKINSMPTPQAPIIEGLWGHNDQYEASEEGWLIQRCDNGMFDIVDDMTLTFATPADARAYVERRADAGSDLHGRALAACVALSIVRRKP